MNERGSLNGRTFPSTFFFLFTEVVGHSRVNYGFVLVLVFSLFPLLARGTGNVHAMEVIDAVKGAALFTYQDTNSNSLFWGAATISNGVFYEENMDGTLDDFGL